MRNYSIGRGYKQQSPEVFPDNADRHNITAANQMWPGPKAWMSTSCRNHIGASEGKAIASYDLLLWLIGQTLQTSWGIGNHNKLSSFAALIECFHTHGLFVTGGQRPYKKIFWGVD